MSAGTSWATVTCGWYGKDSVRASGPRRTSVASSSQLPMPLATATNTTSRHRAEGAGAGQVHLERRVAARDLGQVRADRRPVGDGTSVGGSSVTCGGTRLACGSPTLARQSTSSCAHGSGIGTTMPSTRVLGDASGSRWTNVSSFIGARPAAGARKPTRS